jgi:thiol-disulfide isomerase/thioredoxin
MNGGTLRMLMNDSRLFEAGARLVVLLLVLAGPPGHAADAGPYDPALDVEAAYRAAIASAAAEDRLVLVVFGANWCPDCRRLAEELSRGTLAALIERELVVVKVDVGNWDHNLEFVARFGEPIASGIPSIALVGSDGVPRFVTRAGELATVRHAKTENLTAWFEALIRAARRRPGGTLDAPEQDV